MLEVKNLYFRHHLKAPLFFEDLSFTLETGHLHLLSGKNGVGKSTLFQILNTNTPPGGIVTGEVKGGKITLVNQRYDQMIADQFTFDQNLQFANMSRFPLPFSKFKKKDVNLALVEQFHINRSLPAYQLSGGQRQILSLLMILQKNFDVLLLDEPTATLDEQNAALVFDFLSQLTQVTLLVICHNQELIARYLSGKHLQLETTPSGIRKIYSS